jgi:alpha-glucosidase
MHDVIARMRKVLDKYDERMMIAEIYLPVNRLVTYYGLNNTEAHLPFNFMLITLPWDPLQIAVSIDEYEAALPKDAWPNWVMGNHDQPRVTSRIGQQQAKVAAILLLTLRGTPTIYYGEEIGMRDVSIPLTEVQDPQGLNMPGKNLSRDPERTPMQWDNSANAGFTDGKPWLRPDRAFPRENVQVQEQDNYSSLTLYRRLIQLRQEQPSLMTGDYKPVYSDEQMIVYIRQAEGHPGFLMVLNFSHRPCYFAPRSIQFKGTILIDTIPEQEQQVIENTIDLSGDEALVVRLDAWQFISSSQPNEPTRQP